MNQGENLGFIRGGLYGRLRAMRALLAVLLLPALAASADQARVLTAETAEALFRKSPEFAGRSDRSLTRARVIDINDADVVKGWMVEVEWREKGAPVVGRALVVIDDGAEGPAPGQKMFFRADGWVVPYRVLAGGKAEVLLEGLQRARTSANEAMAKGDLRTLISAQAAYANDSGGRYGTEACLRVPKDCLPEVTTARSTDPDVLRPERQGYRRRLSVDKEGKTFVFTATPIQPGVTGRQAYCVDQDLRLCALADAGEPDVAGGSCPKSCRPID